VLLGSLTSAMPACVLLELRDPKHRRRQEAHNAAMLPRDREACRRGGERLPSQTQLMAAYEVAMGTAAAALAKLAAAGLSRGKPGRGTFAVDLDRARPLPVLEVMAAASLCRQVAATSFPPGTAVTMGVGGDRDENTEYAHEKTAPPRQVDVSALAVA
jgi:hypothetical protein